MAYNNLVNSATDVDSIISELNRQKSSPNYSNIVGGWFEEFVWHYLHTKIPFLEEFDLVYHLGSTAPPGRTAPSSILEALNLPESDQGIDFLARKREKNRADTIDGDPIGGELRIKARRWVGIQAKYVANRSKRLQWGESLATFEALLGRANLDGGILITTSDMETKLSMNKNIRHYAGFDFDSDTNTIQYCIQRINGDTAICAFPILSPRAHQKKIIESVVGHFNSSPSVNEPSSWGETGVLNDRARIQIATGAGKTLTARFISDKLRARTTLCFVPTLPLLSQTYEEWGRVQPGDLELSEDNSETTRVARTRRENSIPNPWRRSLLIGSDVALSDEVTGSTPRSERTVTVPYVCTTSELDIQAFLESITRDRDRDREKVNEDKLDDDLSGDRGGLTYEVYCTYQSSSRLLVALERLQEEGTTVIFDLVVYDEAHRTAGSIGLFNLFLRRGKPFSKRSLFQTATEKVIAYEHLSKEDSGSIQSMVSMDNEAYYGKLVFNYGLHDAIRDGFLCPYRINIPILPETALSSIHDRRRLSDGQRSVHSSSSASPSHNRVITKGSWKSEVEPRMKGKNAHIGENDNPKLREQVVEFVLGSNETSWSKHSRTGDITEGKTLSELIINKVLLSSYVVLDALAKGASRKVVIFTSRNRTARLVKKVLFLLLESTFRHKGLEGLHVALLSGKSSMKTRRTEIAKFTSAEYGIICNARIFQEGVDIPCVDGVCFADSKSSTLDIIQSIGRGLRLHPSKKRLEIYIPVLSTVSLPSGKRETDREATGEVGRIIHDDYKHLSKGAYHMIDRVVKCLNNGQDTAFLLETKTTPRMTDITSHKLYKGGKIAVDYQVWTQDTLKAVEMCVLDPQRLEKKAEVFIKKIDTLLKAGVAFGVRSVAQVMCQQLKACVDNEVLMDSILKLAEGRVSNSKWKDVEDAVYAPLGSETSGWEALEWGEAEENTACRVYILAKLTDIVYKESKRVDQRAEGVGIYITDKEGDQLAPTHNTLKCPALCMIDSLISRCETDKTKYTIGWALREYYTSI